MRHQRLLPLSVVLVFLGCGASSVDAEQRPRSSGPDQLTSSDLVVRDYDNVLDAIRALRPNWLRDRGQISLTRPSAGQVIIYMDGTRVGGPDFLRRVQVHDVSLLRYLNASDATNRFGTGHAGGVIMVTTKTG